MNFKLPTRSKLQKNQLNKNYHIAFCHLIGHEKGLLA